MNKLRLMKTGHGDQVVAEWDADAPELIEIAEREFNSHRSRGAFMFRVDGPGLTEPITNFDRFARELLIVPSVQGG